MKWFFVAGIILALFWCTIACTPAPVACVPGRVVPCPCPDGTNGLQTCSSHKTWVSCSCSNGSSKHPQEPLTSQEPSTPDGGTNPTPEHAPDTSPADGNNKKLCFERDVFPIIASNCAMSGCHDSKTKADDIDLSSYKAIMTSEDGEMVVPGKPDKSELLEAILDDDPEDRMPPPPHKPLSASDIATIRRWILEGATLGDCSSGDPGGGNQCKTDRRSYKTHIAPMLKRSCVGCHSKSNPQGKVDLSTLEGVKASAKTGKLVKSIEHAAGVKPMPPIGKKWGDCDIKQLKAWIQQGTRP